MKKIISTYIFTLLCCYLYGITNYNSIDIHPNNNLYEINIDNNLLSHIDSCGINTKFVVSNKGCEFQFINQTKTNNEITISAYHWDFGDGYRSTEIEPLHVFKREGIYRVTLYTFGNDNLGDCCSQEFTQEITVLNDCQEQISKDRNENSYPEEAEDLFSFFPNESDICQDEPFLNATSFNDNPQNDWNIFNNTNVHFESENPGCEDEGYVAMFADHDVYSAITQKTIHQIEQLKYYQLSLCFRTNPDENANLRIKIVAFNDAPSSFTPASEVAIIGVTGHLPNTEDEWVRFQFPAWEANKNFDHIAIIVECDMSDGVPLQELDIDNVCFTEVKSIEAPPNYDFTYTRCDSLVYPKELTDLIQKYDLKIVETETELNIGNLNDLYGHKYDLSTDLWYKDNKPFNNNIGAGITDLSLCDSIYNVLDTNNIVDNPLIDSILNYIDPFVASRTFNNSLNGSFPPTTPLVAPSNDCLFFDGIDDHIRINDKVTNNIGGGNFTIEMTINPDLAQNSNDVVLLSNYSVHTGSGPFPLIYGTGFRILLHKNGGIYNLALQQEGMGSNVNNGHIYYIYNNGIIGDIIDGDCHQIVISRSSTNLNFYIDGIKIGSKYLDPFSIPALNLYSNKNLLIGKDTNTPNAYKGTIYDFRIWNRARSDIEILNTKRTKRFSYTESGLITNFELLNIQGQTFNNTAYNSISATLGANNLVGTDEPSSPGYCCDDFDPACTGGFVEDPTKPFGGRSIVFVHGLKLKHIFEPFSIPSAYTGSWPNDKEDFYVGDYNELAIDRWEEHIIRELGGMNNPTNNYLITSYPCNQRLPYGVSTIISQIKDAIETGRGVVWSNSGNSTSDCKQVFGEEIVIISHSTGGLVMSTFLGLGELSKTPSLTQATFGDFSPITDRMKAHIAFNPAISGSAIARVGLAISSAVGLQLTLINKIFNLIGAYSWDLISALNPLWTHKTILVDLEPIVSNVVWGNNTYHHAKCKTVTSAGGYLGLPKGKIFLEALVTKNIIPGLDDGVVQMDCACARKKNPTPILPYLFPSKFLKRPNIIARNFDMGNQILFKAYGMYKEMSRPYIPLTLGNACISGKAPSGMLTWKLNDGSAPPRWHNHYSLLQGTGYHYEAMDMDINGHDYYSGIFGAIPMYEESKVITDATIYNTVSGTNSSLVHPSIQNSEVEVIRKKTLGFHFFGKYFEIIIWKRTYHLMGDYQNNDAVSYMYKYVLKP